MLKNLHIFGFNITAIFVPYLNIINSDTAYSDSDQD
jgi:hypothetical protein